MKFNKTKPDQSSTNPSVRLEFSHPTAKSVFVAGTFNQWSPEATPMTSNGAGRWTKELSLPPGIYEYRLIVDGQWLSDPFASAKRPNPFGGSNSVLVVPAPAETPKRHLFLSAFGSEHGKVPKRTQPIMTPVSTRNNIP